MSKRGVYRQYFLLSPWERVKAFLASLVSKDRITARGTFRFDECDEERLRNVTRWLKSLDCPIELRVSRSCSAPVCRPVTITLVESDDETFIVEIESLDGNPILPGENCNVLLEENDVQLG